MVLPGLFKASCSVTIPEGSNSIAELDGVTADRVSNGNKALRAGVDTESDLRRPPGVFEAEFVDLGVLGDFVATRGERDRLVALRPFSRAERLICSDMVAIVSLKYWVKHV